MFPEKRAVGAEADGQVAEDARSKKPKVEISSNAAMAVENDQRQLQEIGGKDDGSSSAPDIDEDLHSRQLAVYGRETMQKLFTSNVLISGLNGLGAEIAKNIVLAGVKSITLHDVENVEMWDLSSNFFLAEEDIGKNRAVACVKELQELNNAVLVSTITEELSEENLSDFQAVVFTDISLDKAITFDDYCHNHQPPISFIKAEVCGLFGSIFCDFGPQFTVFDVTGTEPHKGIIASINKGNPTTVLCVDDEPLVFQDGDFVVFSEVQGMNELNDGMPRKINDVRMYSFTLEDDSTHFGAHLKGGIVTQVKLPKVLQFKPLRDALKDPGEFLDRERFLHLAFQALDKFKHDFRRYPVAGSEEDVERLLNFILSINESSGNYVLEEIDEIILSHFENGSRAVLNPMALSHFANGSRAVLNPMAALFGGIVGQEVLKSCSGKFHPLFQFFYFDSVESLPVEPLEADDVKPLNSRYDAQISVFGSKLQKKLGDANVFIVGAGALGCEFLKNLALMGVSCTHKGKLTITDDDVIAKSNLSRQFLFRGWNIGQAKSTMAASAAAKINPSLNIEALQNRVCPETENVFNDAFWNSLDVIINALDNVTARIYVDKRCVYFQKPLLESGTLGTNCSTQSIIPYITENYEASSDPPEKEVPVCTIHSFPHNIDHCLAWACDLFLELLEEIPNEVNLFLSNPSEYVSSLRKEGDEGDDALAKIALKDVINCLEEWCDTFQNCVIWARLKFEYLFSNSIKQLTYRYPEDATTSSGTLIWVAPKRIPYPLQFSSNDPVHLQFIMSASILRAEGFRIPIPDWAKNSTKLADAVDKVPVPEFQPEEEAGTVADNHTATTNDLIAKLEGHNRKPPPWFEMKLIRRDMDDDTNWHTDFISSLANLRARNYGIPEVDKLKAKLIVGKITPAIATSTAMATGLVCLELYKVLSAGHQLRHYRNTFANLAIPLLLIAEPIAAKTIKHEMRWNLWHRWTRVGDLTLKDLLDRLGDMYLYGLTVSFGSTLLYSSQDNHEHRLEKKVVDLVKEVAKFEVPSYRRHVDVTVVCQDSMANIVEIPPISIYFR